MSQGDHTTTQVRGLLAGGGKGGEGVVVVGRQEGLVGEACPSSATHMPESARASHAKTQGTYECQAGGEGVQKVPKTVAAGELPEMRMNEPCVKKKKTQRHNP